MSRYFTKEELLMNNFDKIFTIAVRIIKEDHSDIPFLQTKLTKVLKSGNADY